MHISYVVKGWVGRAVVCMLHVFLQFARQENQVPEAQTGCHGVCVHVWLGKGGGGAAGSQALLQMYAGMDGGLRDYSDLRTGQGVAVVEPEGK